MGDSYVVEFLTKARDSRARSADYDEAQAVEHFQMASDWSTQARITRGNIADIDRTIQKLREQE